MNQAQTDRLMRRTKADLVMANLSLCDAIRMLAASHADLVNAQEHGTGVDLEWSRRIEIDARETMARCKGP